MTLHNFLRCCDLVVASPTKLAECKPFVCDNDDLNDFFAHDAAVYQKRLLGKTYFFCLKDDPNTIVSAFTLSNDSIRITNKLNDDDKEQFLESAELSEKNLRRYPAVLIGRLGTSKQFAGQGLGSAVMDFIKLWFRTGNKTGCRFIIVDAYNRTDTLHYYEKSQFKYLIPEERLEAKYMGIGMSHLPLNTRLMYFDLLEIKPDIED